MAWSNRNYGGQRYAGGGFSYFPPAVKFLLASNVAVFVLEMVFGAFHFHGGPSVEALVSEYGALWAIGDGFRPWQLITYMFLHQGLTHILFNMLALWMFGVQVENEWGTKKFTTYYFLCGLGGAAAHLIISAITGLEGGPLVGASGAIFGLLVAFGLLFPDQPIYFYFLIPIKAKYFVGLYIALEVYAVVGSTDNVSHLAHLGGAITGIIYLIVTTGGRILAGRFGGGGGPRMSRGGGTGWRPPQQTPQQSPGFFRRPKPEEGEAVDAEYYDLDSSRRAAQQPPANQPPGSRIITQEEIDRILDKIAASGYQNLTEEEREILFEASKRMEAKR